MPVSFFRKGRYGNGRQISSQQIRVLTERAYVKKEQEAFNNALFKNSSEAADPDPGDHPAADDTRSMGNAWHKSQL
jgi:hypothetical protein